MKPWILREYKRIRAQGWTAKHALEVAQHSCRMRESPFYAADDKNRVTFQGHEFTVRIQHDDSGGMPWDNSDTLGAVETHERPVWRGENRNVLPRGQVWLCEPDSRHYGFSYDRDKALANVRSWKDLRYHYSEQLAAHIVDEEIARLRAFLSDQWSYIGVSLRLGNESDSLWGIESDCLEHIAETLEDMARGLISAARETERTEQLRRAFS